MTTMTDAPDRRIDLAELPPAAKVALLARTLSRGGYRDNTAGHITLKDVDGSLLTNPFSLSWDEVRASDIVRIDRDGRKIAGDYECSPAISLHVELHRVRPDVVVAVHNHPEWATAWAALNELPEVYDQGSAYIPGEVALYSEYLGDVMPSDISRRNIEALGHRNAALLANHGVLVVGPSVGIAHLRCGALERRCRLAWQVKALGEDRGRPMPTAAAQALAALAERPEYYPHYYESAARREIRLDPSVLE